jgi:hypothetical protein
MFDYPVYYGNYLDKMEKSKYYQWLQWYSLIKRDH